MLTDGIGVSTTGGPITVRSSANTDVKALADGTAVNPAAADGVGVAISVNYLETTNLATTGNTTLRADGLVVEALMTNVPGTPTDTTHTIEAIANAGAGSKKVGVAGALAINIVNHDRTEAVVGGGANVDARTGNVTLTAASAEKDTATATATAKAGSTGVGASVALNILIDTVTRAEVEDGAAFAGGNDITNDHRHGYARRRDDGRRRREHAERRHRRGAGGSARGRQGRPRDRAARHCADARNAERERRRHDPSNPHGEHVEDRREGGGERGQRDRR